MVVVEGEIGMRLRSRYPAAPGIFLQFGRRAWEIFSVIASEAKQSSFFIRIRKLDWFRLRA
jgi:hypothetical protein